MGLLTSSAMTLAAAARFIVAGPSCREIEEVAPDAARVRLFTLLRMTVFRRRDGNKWPYRYRRSRALRQLRSVLPDWLWYRGLILPLCLAEVTRLSWRNVRKFGAETRARTGLSPALQFTQVLRLCLANPGTLPTEYYVFGMHEDEAARKAGWVANGYDVEAIVALRQPAGHLHLGSGFPSEGLDILNNKERFRELCASLDLPVSRSCAVFDGGKVDWTSPGGPPRQDLFIKPLYGGGGHGAARVWYSAATDTYQIEPAKKPVTAPYPTQPLGREALVDWLRELGRTIPFVMEVRLTAHPSLVTLVGDRTLPTLRVVSLLDASDRGSILYMYLRAAVTDSPVDNISAGGMAALVDPETDRLGVSTTLFDDPALTHPLTGQVMAGFQVPFADGVRESCITAHRALARAQPIIVPVIGWDITVTADGPLFLEGNALSGLSTGQKLTGKGCWTHDDFRESVLSHLTAIAGTRVPIDPGA